MDDTALQLLQSRESLDFALESGRMGTWDLDLLTQNISCSKEMLRIWGIDPAEFKNSRSALQSKVYPDDRARMLRAVDSAINQQTIYEFEYRIMPAPDQIRWVMSRGRCTFDPGSNQPVRFAGVVYDITDRKEKEEAIAKVEKTRSEFFTIASHELKTPLTCMQLQIQVMQWQLKQLHNKVVQDILESGLKKQQEQLLRISRIVDNILDDSKITDGRLQMQFEIFDLSEMVSSVLEQMKPVAKLNGCEILLINSQTVQGHWDRFRLEQVLLNLLMNSIRYGNKTPIHVEVLKVNEAARLIVRDHGIGIELKDQERIFEKFERANAGQNINGMGLGLYISKNIVAEHGGTIRVASVPHQQTEFIIELPSI